jgi:hypothetical protein
MRGRSCSTDTATFRVAGLPPSRAGRIAQVRFAPWTAARSVSQARAVNAPALRARIVLRLLRLTWFCSVSTLVPFSNPATSFVEIRRRRRIPPRLARRPCRVGDRGHRPVSNDQPSIGDFYSTVRATGGSRPVGGVPCRNRDIGRIYLQSPPMLSPYRKPSGNSSPATLASVNSEETAAEIANPAMPWPDCVAVNLVTMPAVCRAAARPASITTSFRLKELG